MRSLAQKISRPFVFALVLAAAATLFGCAGAPGNSGAGVGSQANSIEDSPASNTDDQLNAVVIGHEPIYVLTRFEQSSASNYNSIADYETDQNGNYTGFKSGQYERTYEYDENGFSSAVDAVNSSTSETTFAASITNTFDDTGRIIASQTSDGRGTLTAEFVYYADSDNLRSVTYSGLTKFASNNLDYLFLAWQFEPLQHLHAEAAWNQQIAKGRGVADIDSIQGNFSEDGALLSVSYDEESVPVNALSKPERANQTIEIPGSAEAGLPTVFEYDENGNVSTFSQNFSSTSANLGESLITYSHKQVDTPSRAASVFGRLTYRL